MPQGPASDLEQVGDARPVPAEIEQSATGLGGMLAGEQFLVALLLLMTGAALRWGSRDCLDGAIAQPGDGRLNNVDRR